MYTQAVIDKLKKISEKETLFESGSNACDASGGNYDDAYSLGIDDGEIALAREILTLLGIK